jgi:2'-hydroxyisoflavone reductase
MIPSMRSALLSTRRRGFLRRSAIAVGALALRAVPRIAMAAPKALRILILGGTGFTGPDQVEYATARGHAVTLFNRNRTRPDLFKGRVEQLTGDLGDDVSALEGNRFDVVIDNPTTFPAWVRNAARHLEGRTGHYIFVSTISVYRDNDTPNADESASTTPMPKGLDPYTLEPRHAGQHHGALKSYAEREVATHYPRHTIIRPGLIVGPLDPTDRFTYWPARIDRGGEVLAPGTPDDPAQLIDARDLAQWTIRMAETGTTGTFNATGPRTPLSMAAFLDAIKGVTGASAHFTWVPAGFLAEQRIRPWRDMPVWIPPGPGWAGFARRNIDRALGAGLTFRPIGATATDTLAWHRTRPEEERRRLEAGGKAGLSAEREQQVLVAWKAKQRRVP